MVLCVDMSYVSYVLTPRLRQSIIPENIRKYSFSVVVRLTIEKHIRNFGFDIETPH